MRFTPVALLSLNRLKRLLLLAALRHGAALRLHHFALLRFDSLRLRREDNSGNREGADNGDRDPRELVGGVEQRGVDDDLVKIILFDPGELVAGGVEQFFFFLSNRLQIDLVKILNDSRYRRRRPGEEDEAGDDFFLTMIDIEQRMLLLMITKCRQSSSCAGATNSDSNLYRDSCCAGAANCSKKKITHK